MSFLAGLLNAAATRPGPIDDYWYQPFSPLDGSVPANARTALTVSTVYRGISVLANTLAMVPLKTMRRGAGNDKDTDRGHRLYQVLHDRPNRWQTSFSWRQMGMGHAVLSGGFYNRIAVRGSRLELIPLHPDRTCVVDQLRDGRLIYEHTRQNGEQETLTGGENMFHVHGLSSDGFDGIPLVELMRRSVELSINTERYGGALFKQAPTMRGFLKYDGKMDPGARQAYEDAFARANSGAKGWFRAPVLERGMDWMSAGMNNEDAQFLETRGFQVEEFARYIGVPAVLLMHADKTSTYASAEQFFQAFLTYDIAHWFVGFEQALSRDLLSEQEQDADETFFEFDRTALLRGDAKARADFYRVMIELGVFTRNEVRALENKNALPGLDDPLTPMNMSRGEADAPPEAAPPAAETPTGPPEDRYRQVIHSSATRLAKKEVTELRKFATKYAADDAGWERSVTRLYEKLTDEISAQLALPPAEAAAYTARHRSLVLTEKASVLETLAADAGPRLAQCALGDHHAPSS